MMISVAGFLASDTGKEAMKLAINQVKPSGWEWQCTCGQWVLGTCEYHEHVLYPQILHDPTRYKQHWKPEFPRRELGVGDG